MQVVEGLKFECGFISPFFVKNAKSLHFVLFVPMSLCIARRVEYQNGLRCPVA